MKTAVAVTLIIVGAALIGLPAVSDYLTRRNIVEAAQGPRAREVFFERMGGFYRFGCWSVGALMIAYSAFVSPRAGKSAAAPAAE